MKKIILLLFVVTSCSTQQNNSTEAPSDSSKTHPLHVALWGYPHYTPTMDSAMSLLDKANRIIERQINGKEELGKAQKESAKLMDSFFVLYHKISAVDTAIIYQYRIKLINQLIDYKLKHK